MDEAYVGDVPEERKLKSAEVSSGVTMSPNLLGRVFNRPMPRVGCCWIGNS